MRFFTNSILFLFLFCLGLASVNAQIVNIEDKRTQLDTTGWFWQLDMGGKLTQNSNSVLALNGAVRVDRLRETGQWLILGNYNLVRANSEGFVNDGFGHLRNVRNLNQRWQWETFGQLQYNRRLLIDLRSLLGTGPRFQIRERENWELAVGSLYMYEYNELEEGEIVRGESRLSTYLSARFQLGSRISFATTSYYQPLLNDFAESRLSSANTLTVGISTRLAFTSNFNITYDGLLARLVPGVPATSYVWLNTLRLRF
jgi:hypothetical protein